MIEEEAVSTGGIPTDQIHSLKDWTRAVVIYGAMGSKLETGDIVQIKRSDSGRFVYCKVGGDKITKDEYFSWRFKLLPEEPKEEPEELIRITMNKFEAELLRTFIDKCILRDFSLPTVSFNTGTDEDINRKFLESLNVQLHSKLKPR